MSYRNAVFVGPYKLLVEVLSDDQVCHVYLGSQHLGVYCSIADALEHKCEWFEESEAV